MGKRRLKLRSETIRRLATSTLGRVRGGTGDSGDNCENLGTRCTNQASGCQRIPSNGCDRSLDSCDEWCGRNTIQDC